MTYKTKKMIGLVYVVLFAFILVACGTDDHSLVGTWTRESGCSSVRIHETDYSATGRIFREDGTGVLVGRSGPFHDSMTVLDYHHIIEWSAENGEITIIFADGTEMVEQYSIENDVLTITGGHHTRRNVFTYIREFMRN